MIGAHVAMIAPAGHVARNGGLNLGRVSTTHSLDPFVIFCESKRAARSHLLTEIGLVICTALTLICTARFTASTVPHTCSWLAGTCES